MIYIAKEARVFASYTPETEGASVRRVFFTCRNKHCTQRPVDVLDFHYRIERAGTPDRFGNQRTYLAFWLGYWEQAGCLPSRACEFCGVRMTAEPLKARTSEAVCDGKCINARRASCECSCGGANHGNGRIR